jgi:hypothetical protein
MSCGRGVGVGGRPRTAVNVEPVADAHRRDDRRNREGGRNRLPNRRRWRRPAAEHNPTAIAGIDGAHAQAPVKRRAPPIHFVPKAVMDRRRSGRARNASARVGARTRAATAPTPTTRFDTCRPARDAGLMVDAPLVPDPTTIIQALQREVDVLEALTQKASRCTPGRAPESTDTALIRDDY